MVTFFFGEQPVGHFECKDYPSQAGRFEYTPYRGRGHMEMAAALRQGRIAGCWFERDERRVAFDVTGEDFVLGSLGEGSKWYVEVHFGEANDASD